MSIGGIATKGFTTVISKLGNTSDSIVPLLAKDTTCNFLISNTHKKNGGERDGRERLIEEFGTEALWIFGIPLSKTIFNSTVYKIANINPKFDVRKLNANASDNIHQMMKNLPKDSKQFKDLQRILDNPKLAKGLTVARFATTTIATLMALRGLIKYKQNQTKKDIEKNLLLTKTQDELYFDGVKNAVDKNPALKPFKANDDTKDNNNPKFKGVGAALADFAFNPVKNMSILDGGISLTRLKEARKGELPEVALKEIGTIAFYYILGAPIQRGFDLLGEKLLKVPSNLNFDVLSNKNFKNLMKDANAKKQFADFLELSDEDLIKKVMTSNDAITTTLKGSGVVKTIKKTGGVNPFKKLDVADIKQTVKNMSEFLEKQAKSGVTLDKFISKAKTVKAFSIFANLGISIAFVGLLMPKLTFLMRQKLHGSKDNPAIVQVENQFMANKSNA